MVGVAKGFHVYPGDRVRADENVTALYNLAEAKRQGSTRKQLTQLR
jgi:hypothetical protein